MDVLGLGNRRVRRLSGSLLRTADARLCSGRYVVLTSSKDTGRSNLLWIADLEECDIGPDMKWQKGALRELVLVRGRELEKLTARGCP